MTRAELIKELKSAKGPDCELDNELELIAAPGEIVWKQTNYTMEMYQAVKRPSANHVGGFSYEHIPHYTASIDAAISLVERVRPGWSWKVGVNENHQFPQVVMSRSYPTNKIVTVEAATPALAILIAMLESLNDAKEAK